MAESPKHLKIWYDAEGDYLEVIFDQKAGYFRETENDGQRQRLLMRTFDPRMSWYVV